MKATNLENTRLQPPQLVGFMKGQIQIPSNFDQMGNAEIATLFGIE